VTRLASLLALVTLVVLLSHAAYLSLPYFWDEMGQFVPAALDILRDGAWVPHSTVPNAHPPGVMAYLAVVWKLFGYSISATRAAMLLLASLAVFLTWRLSERLNPGLNGAWAFAPVILLLLDPLFYMQSMLAQLDMPAMLFTLLVLVLFLEGRHKSAALASVALVLAKETGALLPLILGAWLWMDRKSRKQAWLYAVPFFPLAVWFFVLWRTTGHLFGNPGFTHYNLAYALNPVRAAVSLVRRIYYLFIADFRWVGTIGILYAWRRASGYSTHAWKITWAFIASHTLMVSLLGGAELERYLLPVIPLIYIAMAAAWSTVSAWTRNATFVIISAGLLLGLFVNPPFPFPYENNLAMVDFVRLQRDAALYLGRVYPNQTIYTAWPLTQALRDPAFGYVGRGLAVSETSDLRRSTLEGIDPSAVDVLVVYSRTWEPDWGVLRWPLVQPFLTRYYEYGPQMNADEIRQHFGFVPVQRWTRSGQWIEIYARAKQPNTAISLGKRRAS
jgi:Dolichyl-phosphate-mannose-protein mannosyltransferase